MPTKRLSDLFIDHVKVPASGRVEYFDSKKAGLTLRVTSKGAKSWCLFYRMGGRLRRFTIGSYERLNTKEARKAADDAWALIDKGIDPGEQKRARRAAPDPNETVNAVSASYLERYVAKNCRQSTYDETKRIFDVDVLPGWGKRAIGSISKGQVQILLETIAERGAEVQANRTLARLKTFFGWCAEQGRIAASPAAGMKPLLRETARDRALSDQEIQWFWQGCGTLGWPFEHLFKLLLVTAQRRDEVGGLTLPELDLEKRLWVIPRERAKSDRANEVALSQLALDIIETARAERDKHDHLKDSAPMFTTTGETVVSGFSRAKVNLDRKMEKLARKARGFPEQDADYRKMLKLKAKEEIPRLVPEWILHDLRRTAATGMAKLNVAPHVVDKILNHVSGTIRGVAAVYNRFAYASERQAALESWGHRLTALIEPMAVENLSDRGDRE
jgi:integrase